MTPPLRALTRALQALEAAALWLLVELVRLVPTETASAIGGWLGATFGPWLPRSAVARDNLRRAFPETSAAEVEAIVRGMWSNLGRMAFEYPHLDRFRPDAAGGRVEIVGAEHLAAMRQEGRSVIMFSGHLANWELLGPTAAALGVHLNLFYRAPNNPYLGWLFDLRRSGTGEMLPKGVEGAKRALKLFKAGRHFGMLVDQKMNDGIPVRFFGRDAMTAPALAQFALRFHCPVLPARIERLPGARFRITILPPMTFERSGDTAADVKAAMTRVNAQLESWIRERPAEWLWLHRRWPAERRA